MSLITRCPHCSTAFKVVPDQLRLGQGWVRCGRCRQAFRAEAHFVQLEAAINPPSEATQVKPSEALSTEALSSEPAAIQPAPIAQSHTADTDKDNTDGDDDADHQHETREAHEGPQTLLPVDAVDAIDELVALGAMRPAGNYAVSDTSSPEDVYATTLPIRTGFMDSYAATPSVLPSSKDQADTGHTDTGNTIQAPLDTDLPSVASATPATDMQAGAEANDKDRFRPETASSLEAWRMNKGKVKFKPPRTKLKKIQIADQELNELNEQVNKTKNTTTLLEQTKPWHPNDAKERADDEPSFVAKSLSRERWQRWPVRLAMTGLLLVGLALLAAQLAYLNRHYLAAAMPESANLLSALCEPVNAYTSLPCDVLPIKRIEAMRVDSHALASELSADTSASGASPGYVMNITLKNLADLPNAWPALEIAFTDISGSLQARRVLQPREYLPASTSDAALTQGLKARDEQRIAVRFEAPSLRVGGYEITAFYP